MKPSATYYEFFSGGGFVRAGLGNTWKCLFANDICNKKSSSYVRNWGQRELVVSDINEINISDLPSTANLVWASFPCQDLSLAGNGHGFNGTRSATFWPFINLMTKLRESDRAPKIIALENVLGTLTANGGSDFRSIISSLSDIGYVVGAVVLDARHFVPQSRQRLFIIAVRDDIALPDEQGAGPDLNWHPPSLQNCYANLKSQQKSKWVWWALPKPRPRKNDLIDILECDDLSLPWHSEEQTEKLLSLMNERHRQKVDEAIAYNFKQVGGVYKRLRVEDGVKKQRSEVRFDGIAGCLRTPKGGASLQTLLVVENGTVRSRRLSTREAARLMGLRESYRLPETYSEAYHLMGDGVAVPVVRYLRRHLFEPILHLDTR